MQEMLQWPAHHEQDHDQAAGHERHAPPTRAADDAHRGGDPDRSGCGQPAHFFAALFMDDDPGPEKTDAGDDALDGTADGVAAVVGCVQREIHRRQRDQGRTQPHQSQGLHAGGLAAQVAVDADGAADEHGQEQAVEDVQVVGHEAAGAGQGTRAPL